MALEDLIPRKSKIYLSHTDKYYTLRPWTLQDQIWMKQEYGEQAKEIFSLELDKLDLGVVARMIYRLIEDKDDFKAKEFKEINEDGVEEKIKVGGYKILLGMIKGFKEQIDLIASLAECIGASNEYLGQIREFGAMAEQEKKNNK